MNGDSYNILLAEGGFIVHVNKINRPNESVASSVIGTHEPRVFVDSSALLNYLHNEFAGSN